MGHIINTLFGPEEVDEGFKECIKCEEVLPLSEFGNSSGGNYPRPECKKCAKKLEKERDQLKLLYPKAPPDHKCTMCGATEDEAKGRGGKNSGTWCIDHDHKTGKFRGWLCHSCNRKLGLFHDSVEELQRAIDYIEGKFAPVIDEYCGVERF